MKLSSFFTLVLSLLLTVFTVQKGIAQSPATKPLTIIIEAAHGGQDNGAQIDNVKEKDINLKYAIALEQEAKKNNIKVIMARQDDTQFPLTERPNLAGKSNADVYIILHTNTNPKNSLANGMEIYTGINHQPLQNKVLGKFVGAEMYNAKLFTLRGVNINPMNSLDLTRTPTVMIELAYLSNEKDKTLLLDKNSPDIIAQHLVKALLQYQQYSFEN